MYWRSRGTTKVPAYEGIDVIAATTKMTTGVSNDDPAAITRIATEGLNKEDSGNHKGNHQRVC